MTANRLTAALLALACATLWGCVGKKCPDGTEDLAGACLAPDEHPDSGHEQNRPGIQGEPGSSHSDAGATDAAPAEHTNRRNDAGSSSVPPTADGAPPSEASPDAQEPSDLPTPDAGSLLDAAPIEPLPSVDCETHTPDVAFCALNAIRVCNAAGEYTDTACDATTTCEPTDAGPICHPNACLNNNGGCDSLSTCTNTYPTPTCGACPAPYLGDGISGCIPVLTGLETSVGVLDPAFEPATLSYVLKVPIDSLSVDLIAHSVADATLVVSGVTTLSGQPRTATLSIGSNTVSLEVSRHGGALARQYEITVLRGYHATRLNWSDPEHTAIGGTPLAASGNTLVLGAPQTTGKDLNGDYTLNSVGAVHVFTADADGTWHEQTRFLGNTAGARLGASVAIDGDTIVAGAPGIQQAFIWERTGSTWSAAKKLAATPAAGDDFGHAVAISPNFIAVGAPGRDWMSANGTIFDDHGAVFMFERLANGFAAAGIVGQEQPEHSWSPNDADVGRSLDFDSDSGLVAGARGSAIVFANNAGSWSRTGTLTPVKSDGTRAGITVDFGTAVAIEGSTIVVTDAQEMSESEGINSTPAVTPATAYPPYGAAFVFEQAWPTGPWQFSTYIKASTSSGYDRFGSALSLRGTRLLIGADGDTNIATGVRQAPSPRVAGTPTGAVYVYDKTQSGWRETAYLKSDPTIAGASLSLGRSVAFGPHDILAGVQVFR